MFLSAGIGFQSTQVMAKALHIGRKHFNRQDIRLPGAGWRW